MHARFTDLRSIYIFGGVPESYPMGFPVEGPEQMPMLRQLTIEHLPGYLCAFDQPSRVHHPKDTALHFYREDRVFQEVLRTPNEYVARFSKYKAVLTPDCSMTLGMSPSKRARQTILSRAVGAVWQSRGLTVIPSIRWADRSDYDLVCSGVPAKSVIAISSYGSMRDLALRNNFEEGVFEITQRLSPVGLVVYGSISAEVFGALSKMTTVAHFTSPTSRNTSLNQLIELKDIDSLF